MQKKGASAIIISIVLVIVAMIIGLFVGFMIGKTYTSDNGETNGQTETIQESRPMIEETEPVETQTETTPAETAPVETEPDSSATVITVGDSKVSMDEVNARLYTLRNAYIENYGEEPWAEVKDGKTVADMAKEQLETEIIRAEICMDKAEEYDVAITDEIKKMCHDEAQNFINGLGEEIAAEFGLTVEAVENVYLKYEVINQLTNVLNDKVYEEFAGDEANKALSAEDLDIKVTETVQKKMEDWKAEYKVKYEAVWENIVVGSVG